MRQWSLISIAIALVSVVAQVLLNSVHIMPSWFRDPLSNFVEPGVAIWWLVLGGPFRTRPDSVTGIAFAALANAVLVSFALWIIAFAVRVIRRRAGQFRN